jgi:aryl-alcohol dehydrogenase-like predicted oxidoreductase
METQKIGLGTAAIGRPQYINIRNKNTGAFALNAFKANGCKVLETAYQQGIRYFDTAPGYGLAEQLLYDWVKDKKDDSIEVATKWGYTYVADFDPNARTHELKDHSITQLVKQWKVSKKLLPYLSTLQIHSATFDTGVLENEEVLQMLAQIKSEHGILIGLTTTGDNQIEVLKKALEVKVENAPLFEVFQITYNILDQSLLKISDLIKANGNRIVIKEALANGRVFPNPNYPAYKDMYIALGQMANKYSVGIDAIALQFCIQTVDPFMVLSGASEPAQIRENLKSNGFQLLEDDLSKLKSFRINTADYWFERKQLHWN